MRFGPTAAWGGGLVCALARTQVVKAIQVSLMGGLSIPVTGTTTALGDNASNSVSFSDSTGRFLRDGARRRTWCCYPFLCKQGCLGWDL